MDEYDNIWELYGLRRNPFFTESLLLFGGDVDVRIGFVGREEEVKRLQTIIGNRGGTRILVTGDVGVGKTTFVNYVRAMAPQQVFFTPLREIEMQEEWTGIDFILNTLAAIYNTIKLRTDLNFSLFSKDVMRKLELLVDIVEEKDKNFSLNFGPIGGGGGSSTSFNVPAPTLTSLHTFFEQLIDEIKKLGYKEIILHYNNLENLEPAHLQRLFNSIRDFIQKRDCKFIFLGNLAVAQVLNQIRRVGSVMSESPIILENLSLKEVKELLEKRIKYLSIPNLVAQKPYDDDVISKLYTLYEGNLRYILNSLSTVFNELVRDLPIKISVKELTKVLPETAKKRWLNKLTPTEQEILFYILKEGEANNKKIADDLDKQRQNISTITSHLLDLSAIRISRIDGKEKYFSIEHSIKWFLLEKDDKKPTKIPHQNIHKEIQEVLKL